MKKIIQWISSTTEIRNEDQIKHFLFSKQDEKTQKQKYKKNNNKTKESITYNIPIDSLTPKCNMIERKEEKKRSYNLHVILFIHFLFWIGAIKLKFWS